MKMNFIRRNLTIIILHATITIILALFTQASIASIHTYRGSESAKSNFDLQEKQWKPSLDPRLESLRNIEYQCSQETFAKGNKVRLKNGVFKKDAKDENTLSVIFRGGNYGDLNGDGKEDAAVYFASKFGGKTVWITLAIVMNQNGVLKNTDCLVLGDREVIQSINIKPHEVTLGMLMHLSGEPPCCPKTPFTYSFKISDDGHIINAKEFIQVSLASSDLALGNIDYANNQLESALNKYNSAIKLYPKYEQAYLARAFLLSGMDKNEQAVEDLNHVLLINPKNTEAYLGRAGIELDLKNYDHVIEDCTKVIQLQPSVAYAYYFRGVAYASIKKHREAINDLTNSINKFPAMEQQQPCDQWRNTFENVYLMRADSYKYLKDYTHALQDIETVINMKPPQKEPNPLCFPEMIEYKSMKGEAYELRAVINGEKNNIQQGIDDINASINMGPENSEKFNIRGSLYFEVGEYQMAIDDLNEALNLAESPSDNLDNNICLASIYYQMGDMEKAKSYYLEAIELEPQLKQGIGILEKKEIFYFPKMKKVIEKMIPYFNAGSLTI